MICEEEILKALEFVLEKQHATLQEDLITISSRLLGYKRTTQDVEQVIEKVITKNLKNGKLQKLSNGMINLK